jgi:hypothetical protein
MKRMTKIILLLIIVFALNSCASRKYLTPISTVVPGYLQTITDDEIRAAFENKPQLVKPLNVAIYDVGSVGCHFADSLSKIDFIKGIYQIPPALADNNGYYSGRYRGWYSSYYSPPETDIMKLRLLAAQGKADLLIVLSPTHLYYERNNFLAATYFLLIPALFVPGKNAEITTAVDMFFIDVRNGFLYATYHNETILKKNYVNLFYQDVVNQQIVPQQVESLVPDMLRETREILSHPEYYITQEK